MTVKHVSFIGAALICGALLAGCQNPDQNSQTDTSSIANDAAIPVPVASPSSTSATSTDIAQSSSDGTSGSIMSESPTPTTTQSLQSSHTAIIVGSASAGALALIIAVCAYIIFRRRKDRSASSVVGSHGPYSKVESSQLPLPVLSRLPNEHSEDDSNADNTLNSAGSCATAPQDPAHSSSRGLLIRPPPYGSVRPFVVPPLDAEAPETEFGNRKRPPAVDMRRGTSNPAVSTVPASATVNNASSPFDSQGRADIGTPQIGELQGDERPPQYFD